MSTYRTPAHSQHPTGLQVRVPYQTKNIPHPNRTLSTRVPVLYCVHTLSAFKDHTGPRAKQEPRLARIRKRVVASHTMAASELNASTGTYHKMHHTKIPKTPHNISYEQNYNPCTTTGTYSDCMYLMYPRLPAVAPPAAADDDEFDGFPKHFTFYISGRASPRRSRARALLFLTSTRAGSCDPARHQFHTDHHRRRDALQRSPGRSDDLSSMLTRARHFQENNLRHP